MTDELQALLDKTRKLLAEGKIRPSQMPGSRAQRISWAYGQVAIENPNITKEMVEEIVDEMDRKEREDLQRQLAKAKADAALFLKQADAHLADVMRLRDWIKDLRSAGYRDGFTPLASTVIELTNKALDGAPAPMSANEYQKLALRTEHTPMFINPAVVGGEENAQMLSRILHGVIGVVTEIGEAADMLKKHLIYGKQLDLTNLMEEAGDKQWYIALILHASGYPMATALERNIAKLTKRYPDKFTPEKALNRDLAAERATLEGAPAPAAAEPKICGLCGEPVHPWGCDR